MICAQNSFSKKVPSNESKNRVEQGGLLRGYNDLIEIENTMLFNPLQLVHFSRDFQHY
jgi:hypothetical protein